MNESNHTNNIHIFESTLCAMLTFNGIFICFIALKHKLVCVLSTPIKKTDLFNKNEERKKNTLKKPTCIRPSISDGVLKSEMHEMEVFRINIACRQTSFS